MVPAHFTVLDRLPLTPNGKIDRQALPAPDLAAGRKTYEAPRSTAEQQLAAIWQAVLQHPDIGIHDNFFELGGDSILSIQIVARAQQAGLSFSPRDLFQYPTIAELAWVAQPLQAARDEQGAVQGEAPLTAIQRWFFANQGWQPHFNQAVLLTPTRPLDSRLLQQVLEAICRHHDILRASYQQQKGMISQTIAAPETQPCPLQVIDLWACEQPWETLEERLNELQASLDLSQGPLQQLAWIQLPAGEQRLAWIVHHLLIDGVSWRILLDDLELAYRQAEQGQAIALPAKTTSYQHWAEQIAAYAKTPACLAELDYWTAVAQQPRQRIPYDYDFDTAVNGLREGDSRQVTLQCSPEMTRALLTEVPAAYRTEIDDVLLTGLMIALHRCFNVATAAITLEGHGREPLLADIDLSRTVGWFTTVYPVILTLATQRSLDYQLRAIKQTLREIPNKGIGLGLLAYLSEVPAANELAGSLNSQIAFNYLGQFTHEGRPSLFEFAPEPNGQAVADEVATPHDLEIQALVTGEQLSVAITFNPQHYQEQTIETLSEHYQQALADIIALCQDSEGNLTPSDIDYDGMNIDELDAILDSLGN